MWLRASACGYLAQGLKAWSDLDLLVEGSQPLPVKRFYQLQDAFEDSELDIRVDILDWHRVSPEFLATIQQQGIERFPLE